MYARPGTKAAIKPETNAINDPMISVLLAMSKEETTLFF